ncbi:unnamed protein product [Echinostoma caproni]|uniref:NADH dehydrogenase [ubiquinone] 1 alpha subcomplex subunit 2 n=1 Tax=Echinostoma caproni TaxID=27848 RepID=A0A183B9J0_9TREM|nr:unnamed protein product [Echinostoma caproni]
MKKRCVCWRRSCAQQRIIYVEPFVEITTRYFSCREFLTKHYATLKRANPQLKFMVREAESVSPKVCARFEYGKEAVVSLVDNTADEVLEKIRELSRY